MVAHIVGESSNTDRGVTRHFATLDLMTGGRVAWNIVTSLNDSEAANFGRVAHLEHDQRYDRAEEFVDVVTRMWGTWDPDALKVGKRTGGFADPAKVHRLDHDGRFFSTHGTFRRQHVSYEPPAAARHRRC